MIRLSFFFYKNLETEGQNAAGIKSAIDRFRWLSTCHWPQSQQKHWETVGSNHNAKLHIAPNEKVALLFNWWQNFHSCNDATSWRFFGQHDTMCRMRTQSIDFHCLQSTDEVVIQINGRPDVNRWLCTWHHLNAQTELFSIFSSSITPFTVGWSRKKVTASWPAIWPVSTGVLLGAGPRQSVFFCGWTFEYKQSFPTMMMTFPTFKATSSVEYNLNFKHETQISNMKLEPN